MSLSHQGINKRYLTIFSNIPLPHAERRFFPECFASESTCSGLRATNEAESVFNTEDVAPAHPPGGEPRERCISKDVFLFFFFKGRCSFCSTDLFLQETSSH